MLRTSLRCIDLSNLTSHETLTWTKNLQVCLVLLKVREWLRASWLMEADPARRRPVVVGSSSLAPLKKEPLKEILMGVKVYGLGWSSRRLYVPQG